MLLVVDVGNTNMTFGLYNGEKLIGSYRLTTKLKRTSDEYGFMLMNFLNISKVLPEDIDDVIVASVVPKIMYSFNNSLHKYLKKEPIIIGPGIKTGIIIKYDNPKEVGADRIVDAVGAHYCYGGDVLVIDIGTATTFEYIDKDGVYRGGCIVPGIEITAQALSTNTAKLPEIEIKYVDKVLTTNTISGMQAGLIHGYIGTVEHIVRKCKQETGKDLKVIATGGLGRIMSENTKEIDIYDPELTFKGLRLVYERNKEKMNGKN